MGAHPDARTILSTCRQFTDYYYQTFDADRNGLAPLYASQILTWTEVWLLSSQANKSLPPRLVAQSNRLATLGGTFAA